MTPAPPMLADPPTHRPTLGPVPVEGGAVPVEGEVLDAVDPHGMLGRQVPGTTVVGYSCRCGDWEAIATGPSSAAWAIRDHDRHRAEA